MSESISNEASRAAGRQEALKEVIRSLHAGRTVDEVKAEFSALLREAGGAEIAELEQALIEDGMPESEIKRLCDVHVAVFEEALQLQAAPDTSPTHPLAILRAENAEADNVMQALDRAISRGEWDKAKSQLASLRQYEKHYVRKENILFPYLERHGFSGPSSVMWAIHDDIRAGWRELEAALNEAPASDDATYSARVEAAAAAVISTIRDMIYKEENIMAPAAMERLTEQDWVEIRKQEPGIGYFRVDALPALQGEELPSGSPGDTPHARAGREDLLPLATGALSGPELNLLLTHLPIDVTFVAADDTVRYFSAGKERIFPRSPAIIGRKVQKCHPPASMHRVQRILDAFREGGRDEAEFWIQMGGRFIHIRYFALRDAEGSYQGTLEVSQDVTGIRALSGEKRLLEDTDG